MFGKRSGSTIDPRGAPPSPAPSLVPAQATTLAAAPPASPGRIAAGADAPKSGQAGVAPPAQQFEASLDTRHSEIFYEVKTSIFTALIEAIDLTQLAKLDPVSSREEIRDIVNEIIAIKNIVMSISEQEELLDDICNDVLGYRPLEPVLGRDDVSDVMVNGATTVYVEIAGKIQRTGIRFRDNQQLLNICQRIVSQVGRRVDESSPICDARLPDGSRVNVIAPPLSIDGPTLILLRIFMSADDRYGVEEPLYRAIVMKAREVHLAGATVLKGPLGFGHSSRLHKSHFIATDERPVVIEICDSEEKINAFLPVLDEMMESGLVTLERARVLQYGRKRSGYFKRLKESVLQHLHIHEWPQRDDDSKHGQGQGPELPREASR